MGKIIHNSEIFVNIIEELDKTQSSFTVISAFVRSEALKELDQHIVPKTLKKRLIVRFRLSDLLSGSTDIEIYNYCINNGWEIYINLDLHSKIMIFDNENFILGSSNVTLSGLGLRKNSNIESCYTGTLNDNELNKIEMFFNHSCLLTKELMQQMIEAVEKVKNMKNNIIYEWDRKIFSLINNQEVSLLWTSEMLFSNSPYDLRSNDINLLGLSRMQSGEIELVKNSFIQSKSYRWLKNNVKSEIYFGELSMKLHNSLIDNPTPHRKDVKQLLANLLNWVVELNIDEFIIDKPRYSQRIRKML